MEEPIRGEVKLNPYSVGSEEQHCCRAVFIRVLFLQFLTILGLKLIPPSPNHSAVDTHRLATYLAQTQNSVFRRPHLITMRSISAYV